MSGKNRLSPSLYARNARVRLSEALFRDPTAEYRAAPFWAWNNELQAEQLLRQIDAFKAMGFGGFHIHSRTGLATPYLGEKFMEMVRTCLAKAEQRKMLTWLYDEDRWPSGYGAGLVTATETHRQKYLLFTATPYNGTRREASNVSCSAGGRRENGDLSARYGVELKNGFLAQYRRLGIGQKVRSREVEWFAYLESGGSVPWFNGASYVDTLSKSATECFIETVHERFEREFGTSFGKSIPAIFTDEPQHVFKESFNDPSERIDLTIPFTTDFVATYQERYGEDILDALPEIFWENRENRPSVVRYRYHEHVTARFAEAYASTIGQWCQVHGLMLSGHMMEEATLFSQTRAVGEAMRSLTHFQLPGIDMLCDQMELNTAKQAQSVARQRGRAGVISELYGVTGWTFDFAGHKAQGDWQAAMGVTVRVPHLAWVSMAGEAKRDYPASIHYQSPWYREYRLVEDHFARVNVVMTRGRPLVRVGVIHPIESYWLCAGPMQHTKAEREDRDLRFEELARWLVEEQIDFDYISEALLEQDGCSMVENKIQVGEMGYEVVIVPSLRTIRAHTVAMLEKFLVKGGSIIFAGEVPSLVDALASNRACMLAKRAIACPWGRASLITVIDRFRHLEVLDEVGVRSGKIFYQFRQDGPDRNLFLCDGERPARVEHRTLRVRGSWRVFARDSITGERRQEGASYCEGWTTIPLTFAKHGHALLTLRPGTSRVPATVPEAWREIGEISDPLKVTLDEPNVLLLDQAEWQWNGGQWQPREEILRINNLVRGLCGLALTQGKQCQPWVDAGDARVLGRVALRFKVTSSAPLKGLSLAIEELACWEIYFNGQRVRSAAIGSWVDDAIARIPLPLLESGTGELVLVRDFSAKTELEWCYLLGDFGVHLTGRHARLEKPVRTLAFGDWTQQGLPFYAGNVTYHCEHKVRASGTYRVEFPHFKAALLSVEMAQDRRSKVAFPPYHLNLGPLKAGKHVLAVTAFGNRHNAFGPLHNADPALLWIGPDAWRSTGAKWAYEYQLKPMGLLTAPRISQQEPT